MIPHTTRPLSLKTLALPRLESITSLIVSKENNCFTTWHSGLIIGLVSMMRYTVCTGCITRHRALRWLTLRGSRSHRNRYLIRKVTSQECLMMWSRLLMCQLFLGITQMRHSLRRKSLPMLETITKLANVEFTSIQLLVNVYSLQTWIKRRRH